jgi:dTDP-4-amino-4,6-dideoxygalactose transaminase
VKLAHLPSWNKLRQERAAEYERLLGDAGNPAVAPHEPSWARAVYHLYVVRVNDRERLIASLNSQGIGTGIHYPIPLHLQSAYHSLGYGPGAFPISEKLATEIVSLPMFPQITSAQQARVVSEIAQFANSTTSALVTAQQHD